MESFRESVLFFINNSNSIVSYPLSNQIPFVRQEMNHGQNVFGNLFYRVHCKHLFKLNSTPMPVDIVYLTKALRQHRESYLLRSYCGMDELRLQRINDDVPIVGFTFFDRQINTFRLSFVILQKKSLVQTFLVRKYYRLEFFLVHVFGV